MIGPSGFQQAPKPEPKQTIEVVGRKTGQVVHRVDVTGKTPRQVATCERGMNRNLSAEFFTRFATA